MSDNGDFDMYELYTINLWYGSESREFQTIEEVVRTLSDEHYRFKWDYRQGKEVLHENDRGSLAQVFHGGRDITRSLCPSGRNLPVLY